MSSLLAVGESAPRVDGWAKVRGSLVFPSDVRPANGLHCRPVFTPYPHAQILAVDVDEALAVPGVLRVLTARDIPGPNICSFNADRPILCDDRARYEGDIIAVVVAESEAAAESGVKRVKVDFSPLPLLIDPEQALQPDALSLHASGNVLHEIHFTSGDPDSVLAREDIVIVEHIFRPPATDHVFLETEAGVAFPEDGGIRIVTGGQNAFYHREQVAQALALSPEKVRVIEPFTGGGFGGKADVNVQILIALAAHLTGRPCRMMWTRHEHFIAGVKRHPAIMHLKGAATRSGEFLALSARVVSDTGAYGVNGNVVLNVLVENLTGPYAIPNVRIDAWSVYTNNYVAGAFRGFGANKGCLAIEGIVSRLARELRMDQVEFRKRNLIQHAGRSGIAHRIIAPIHVRHTLDAVAQHPLWKNRDSLERTRGSLRRGLGMALAMKGYGIGIGDAPDYGSAGLTLGFDGRIKLTTSIVDMGQGSLTILCQMAAEVLQCDLTMFDVMAADTQETDDCGTTAASRVSYAVGRAVISAAQEVSARIRQIATEVLQVRPEAVRIERGAVRDPASGRFLTFAQIAQLAEEPLEASARLRVAYSEELAPPDAAVAHPHVLYSSNAQVAQVMVDTETGQITLERMAVFPEVGQVINPQGVEGQCEGGISQGLGYALMEQVVTKDGRMQNADLATYPIPTALDMPEMETIPIEVPELTGPFGAKGVGENATVPTAPAILDAIEDAIGIRFTAMPVTPEQVLEALEAVRAGRPAADTGAYNGH